jgi:5-methylthioadenosine/S-adenosylhomocysteine deaminase
MSEDMFEALRVGLILNRGLRENTGRPTPNEIFNWATINSARALDRSDLGKISLDMKADLSIIRLDKPHLSPIIDTLSTLVHYGQASDVESVIVDGKWVMKEGVVLTMNEEETISRAQEATVHAWSALKAQWKDIKIPEEFDQFLS